MTPTIAESLRNAKHLPKFVIVIHNHPSGDPTPSEQDILLTQELWLSEKILGVEVLDHIIIGFSDYVSVIKQENLFLYRIGKNHEWKIVQLSPMIK